MNIKKTEIYDIPTGVLLFNSPKTSKQSYAVTFLNHAAKRILLLQDHHDYKGVANEILPPDLMEIIETCLAQFKTGRRNTEFFKRIHVALHPESSFLLYISRIEQGYLVLLHEIRDHIKETIQLRKIANKYKSIFESSLDVFYQTSIDGQILEISPSVENYIGYTRKEMVGKSVFEFYADASARNTLINRLQKTGRVYDYEIKFKTKSKGELYVSTNAHVVQNEHGELTLEGALRDITTRKKAEKKLKESNKQLKKLNIQKDKLFSVISHDLKNALSAPAGLYDLILDDYESLSKVQLHEYLTVLNKSNKNALELLDDLLAWSKNQFLDIHAVREETDLIDLVDEVLLRITPNAEEKEITIENRLSGEVPVRADRNMLKTIFRNLISNAIKFSHPGGVVIIDGFKTDSQLQISVSDYGIGMDKKTQKKIMDRSINYTTAGTSGEKGSGLGLDLCLDFIQKHKGSIWVESEPGKGSTFYFSIPANDK
jgi:PAS domain S-box-containing protein